MKRLRVVALAVLASFLVVSLAPTQAGPLDDLKQRLGEQIKKRIDEELGTNKPDNKPEQSQQQQPKPGQITITKPNIPVDARQLQGLRVKVENYPRITGSTSAHPLGVMAATALAGKHWLWALDHKANRRLIPVQYPRVSGPNRLWTFRRDSPIKPVASAPPIDAFREGYVLETLMKRSWHDGTNQGYVALIEGKADLALECRLPSADERKLMAEKKVDLVATPIALDAFVFLLNTRNPVPELSIRQIRNIYAGKITDWSAIGKHTGKIKAYVRNRNSGSQETMQSLVMRETKIVAGRNMLGRSMIGPYNQLSRDKDGIGFTFQYYHVYMSPMPGTKVAAVNGVLPTRESIAARTYPFVTEVYLVHRKTLAPDSAAGRIARWFRTDAGQAAVMRSGYVPIRPLKNPKQ